MNAVLWAIELVIRSSTLEMDVEKRETQRSCEIDCQDEIHGAMKHGTISKAHQPAAESE